MMNNFPFILLSLAIISGAICLIDWLFFRKAHPMTIDAKGKQKIKRPLIADYAYSFFPVFVIVFLLRSFCAQLYNVPSGSLEPTVIPGDLILVNQFAYGFRLPIWNKLLFPVTLPHRGDIVVFHWPVNPQVDFVKRVIGLPGDHISYINRVLSINGQEAPQTYLKTSTDGNGPGGPYWEVETLKENLLGTSHLIYNCAPHASECPGIQKRDFKDLTVPPGLYFMMGDNRGDSDDSRDWGFVPEKNLVGKGEWVVLSWDSSADWKHKIRWDRIGKRL